MTIKIAQRVSTAAWLIALAGCITACQGTPFRGTTSTLVDLTHPFDTETIYWPTEDGFKLHVEAAGLTDAVEQKQAQLLSQFGELSHLQFLEVRWISYLIQ